MPQQVEAYLRSLNTSDRARAAAWDAVYSVKDDAEAQTLLAQLPFSDDVKATLWDARKGMEPEAAAPPVAPEPPPSATSRFFSNAGEMLNPVSAIKGLAHAVRHPLDTGAQMLSASGEQLGKAKEAVGQGRYSEAVGHTFGAIPIIGPAAAAAGEQIASGDVAGGLGKGAGLVLGAGLAGPATRTVGKVVKPVAQATGRRLYQSALKPTKAVLNDVRPVAGTTARETLLQTGLDEAIPVTARGVRKAETLIDSLNGEVQARIAKAAANGKTVDPVQVEQAIADVAKDFTNQINAQPDLAAIEAVRQNFATNPNASQVVAGPAGRATLPKDIPVDVAQQMKTNTYKGLRGKYGVERGATIEAEKAGARGLREGIEQAAPEVAGLNAREGALISLEHALTDAMRRRGNYDVLGLKPAIGAATSAASGSLLPMLVTLVDRFPGMVSRAGIWINRTGQRSGRLTNAAGKATVAGATSPSESRTRTTAPAWQAP